DGNDIILGNVDDAADGINGGEGNDTIVYTYDYSSIDGTYTENVTGITVNLPELDEQSLSSLVQPDTLESVEGVVGTSGDDLLRGSTGENLIIGGSGDDIIRGRAGDDVIYGRGIDDPTNPLYGLG